VGLEVATAGGHELGRLVQVLERPANDVWVAERDGVEQLIPAIQDAVLEVDLGSGRVVVADWLLEEDDPPHPDPPPPGGRELEVEE
jgi:ribosomal 30S subunit maturation factor RimM